MVSSLVPVLRAPSSLFLKEKLHLLELLSNLVFEGFGSCGDLAGFGGFNSVFERDACDDFGEVIKAA